MSDLLAQLQSLQRELEAEREARRAAERERQELKTEIKRMEGWLQEEHGPWVEEVKSQMLPGLRAAEARATQAEAEVERLREEAGRVIQAMRTTARWYHDTVTNPKPDVLFRYADRIDLAARSGQAPPCQDHRAPRPRQDDPDK